MAPLQDERIPTRIKLSALWIALMALYAYADILSFYKPGYVDEIQGGKMGPVDANQSTLLLAGILMTMPALMIILSLTLPAPLTRNLNVGVGGLYTLVNVSNVVGETWAYYLAFGVVEIALTLIIVGLAWKWPRAQTP